MVKKFFCSVLMLSAIIMCAVVCACQQESENPTDTVYCFAGVDVVDTDTETSVGLLYDNSVACFRYGEFRIKLNYGLTYAYGYTYNDGKYVLDVDYSQSSIPSGSGVHQEMYVEFTEDELQYVTVIYSAENGEELSRMVLIYQASE